MSVISSSQDLFTGLGMSADSRTAGPANDPTQIGLNTFLKLMVTQLNNQDPFKPMENGDFLGQIAQFASVTGLDKLNNNFDGLATSLTSGQALQAGTLIGREVLAPIEDGYLPPGGQLRGLVQLADSTPQLSVRILDVNGATVRDLSMGSQSAGTVPINWDGLTTDGDAAAPGVYKIHVEAKSGESSERQQTLLFSRVESVGVNNGSGLTLNLEGLGPIAFNNVKQVSNWE
jgi:flagellar basal-body rod modification protein FlgD